MLSGVNLVSINNLSGPILFYSKGEKDESVGAIIFSLEGGKLIIRPDWTNAKIRFHRKGTFIFEEDLLRGHNINSKGFSVEFSSEMFTINHFAVSLDFSKEELDQTELSKVRILQGWDAVHQFFSSRERGYEEIARLFETDPSLKEGGCEIFKIVACGEAFHQKRLDEAEKSLIFRVEEALRSIKSKQDEAMHLRGLRLGNKT